MHHYSSPELAYHSKYPVYLNEIGLEFAEGKVESHKHSLILSCDQHEEIICDGCIDHATSPYYKCGQRCGFFLHTTCAVLPKVFEVELTLDDIGICFNSTGNFKLHFPENPWEVSRCIACHSFSNGYGYKCSDNNCDLYLDMKCFFLSGLFKHIGHQHQLSARTCRNSDTTMWFLYMSGNKFRCGGCGESKRGIYAAFEPCKFKLGYECATLPATVKHRWDKHPLVLYFPPFFSLIKLDIDQDDEFFCKVCEEEIHPQSWAYRCTECDHSFHPRCIPTLGESRNIKFGATVSLRSHPHLLTFVPQAKLTGRCHSCHKSVYSSRSFECAPCGYYICHDCIANEEPVLESVPGSSTSTTYCVSSE